MRINTITCHNCYNAGASLQAYALQTYLKEQGHDVKIIDYLPDYLRHYKLFGGVPKRYAKPVIKQLFYLYFLPRRVMERLSKSKKCYDQFTKNYLCLTERYSNYDELIENPPEADVYIAGSDQIWNTALPNGRDPAFYLQFTPVHKTRASYAASFAVDEIQGAYKDRISGWLQSISYISVREKTAMTILKSMNILNGEQVVDPVFLLSEEHWKQLAGKRMVREKYVLVVDYNRGSELRSFANKIATEKGAKILAYNPFDKNCVQGGPLEFLSLVYNAEVVIANSFHAVAFSVIFEKDFFVFMLRESNTNSRMVDLLNSISMLDRIVTGVDCAYTVKECDYKKARGVINKRIKDSKDYLSEVISSVLEI